MNYIQTSDRNWNSAWDRYANKLVFVIREDLWTRNLATFDPFRTEEPTFTKQYVWEADSVMRGIYFMHYPPATERWMRWFFRNYLVKCDHGLYKTKSGLWMP